jgi:hypothetical protein
MGAFRRDLKVARAESLRTSQFMAKNFDAVKGAMIGLAGVAGIGMVAKSIIRMGMEFKTLPKSWAKLLNGQLHKPPMH